MAHVDKSYYDRNYNSKNPLRRYAHRTRFKKSIAALELNSGSSILDFGAGDGLFLNQIKDIQDDTRLVGYEPYMDAIPESRVRLIKDWSEIDNEIDSNGNFDYVTCFEVLEHFSPSRQYEALSMMQSAIKPEGTVIISVPIEKGLPALVKNMIRRVNLPQSNHIFTYDNIFKSVQGRSLLHLRDSPEYHSHMGFYFTDLEKEIVKLFKIVDKSFSPVGGFSHQWNSQVFYQLYPINDLS